MIFLKFLYSILFTLYVSSVQGLVPRNSDKSVLLSNVKSLTLRKDLKTTYRRVSAVPQLNCIGGNAKGLYNVDIMRCTNQGSDYDDENIQWTCTASLPEEFKLGSTDVICEGYDSSTDPHILKGSCGVEYRLLLTDKGEAKYGGGKSPMDDFHSSRITANTNKAAFIFWIIFLGVIVWMLYAACVRDNTRRPRRGSIDRTIPWGGGDDGGNDDPPPPYDANPKPSTSQSSNWKPGFWSGAATGAAGTAAGYTARDWREQQRREQERARGIFGGTHWPNTNTNDDAASGSSRPARNSNSTSRSGSSFSSKCHESTSFGTTGRR